MKLVKYLCLVLAFCALPIALWAQTSSGSISGTVSDPNGAVIQGATVVATHVPTGRQYSMPTSQAGLYVFPNLPTGPYTITVKQEGFKTYVQSGIEVRLDLRESIDIKLALGKVTQSIEVKASASVLETANATRGSAISPQTMATLPLWNGGLEAANSFVGFMPGVNTNSNTSVNGSNGRAMEVLIDGASSTNPESGGLIYYFPGFYAYSEMKLLTSGFSAENGRVGGGIQEYVTKSGTNAVHGAAFFNFKRQFFDAVSWANNSNPNQRGYVNSLGTTVIPTATECKAIQTKACRPMERFNEEGGYAGGPVYLPHIYDGRNRTFWYFTWAGVWSPQTVGVATETVPTAKMRQGDFSELLDTAHGLVTTPINIYHPTTASNPSAGQTAYTGNIMPTTDMSTLSKNYLPYVPLPNPNLTGLSSNYTYNNVSSTTDKNWSIKIDHSIHTRNRIAFFMTHRAQVAASVSAFDGPLGSGLATSNAPFYERASDDFVINPHILLHSYWGLSQERQFWHNTAQNGWGTKLGFPIAAGTNADATPVVGFSGDLAGNPTSWGATNGSKVNNGNQYNWTLSVGQSLSWIHGKHEFKMGWEIRRMQTNNSDWAGSQGAYTFSRYQTACANSGVACPQAGATGTGSTTGSAFASFLLGDVNSASQPLPPIYQNLIRYGYHAGYFQDNWRVRPTFTVNLGVRYDVPIGWHEQNGNYGSFNPTAPDYFPAGNGVAAVTLPGAIQFMGNGTNRIGQKRPYPTDFSEVGPRLGFAWNVRPSVVIRSSFGIFYQATAGGQDCCTDGFGGGSASQSTASGSSIQAFQWDAGGYNPNKTSGNPGGVQPFPSGVSAQMVPGVDNFGGWYDGGTGNDLVYMGPHYGKAPRIYDWNLTVQKEYKGWLLEGAYVGNRGHGTNGSAIMNTLPLSLLYLGTAGPAGASNLLTTKITSTNICTYSSVIGCTNGVPNLPFSTFLTGWGSSATLSQALRQYPQYDSITYNNSGDGRTWYDSMQLKAEHRFGDLNLQGSYVYSKNLAMLSYQQVGSGGSYSTQGAQDDYNPYADKSYSYYDIPNFVNVVASYKLPFGRDKKFLHSSNPIVNHLVGNWTFAWDQQYRSGTLLQILSPTNNLGNGGALQKATSTGLPIRTNVSTTDIVPNNPNTRWFNYGTGGNALPYKQTAAFTLGSASYFNPVFRQPWFRNESMSLNKQIRIRESILMNYEVNFYDVFNRTDFGGIQGSLSSAAFGESTGAQAGPRNITMGLRLEF